MNIQYLSFSSRRRFGVEIEVNRSLTNNRLAQVVSDVVGEGCIVNGWHYTCNNSNWIVKPDSSCGDYGDKYVDGGGYEVVSSVGKGIKHIQTIAKVVKALKSAAAQVNKHCGLHCQVEIKDYDYNKAAVLLAYWCKIEPLLSHAVPNRRNKSNHCKLYTKNNKKLSKANKQLYMGGGLDAVASTFWRHMKSTSLGAASKRNTITLVNYQRTKSTSDGWYDFNRPTVELRYPESSLEDYDVKNWVRLFVHFVEHCSTLDFPSDLRPASFDDMLYILGLKSLDGFSVLSPGLFETKCWLLSRLEQYSRSVVLARVVKRHWVKISSDNVKWKFNFPQVYGLQKSNNKKCVIS